jgi:hypothetical protein
MYAANDSPESPRYYWAARWDYLGTVSALRKIKCTKVLVEEELSPGIIMMVDDRSQADLLANRGN